MFTQHNCLMMHFSELIPIIKQRLTSVLRQLTERIASLWFPSQLRCSRFRWLCGYWNFNFTICSVLTHFKFLVLTQELLGILQIQPSSSDENSYRNICWMCFMNNYFISFSIHRLCMTWYTPNCTFFDFWILRCSVNGLVVKKLSFLILGGKLWEG